MESHLLYSVNEAAEQLRIGRSALYELINTGRLRSLKIGNRRLIARRDLEAFIASSLDADASVPV